MKKITLLFLSLFIYFFPFAQWVVSGNNIYYNNGKVGIGTSVPTTKLHVEEFTSSPTSITGGYFNAESSSTEPATGLQGVARYSNSSGTGVRLIGVSGIAFHFGSGTVTSMRAVQANASVFGSGNVTDAYSVLGSVGSAGGAITNGYGFYMSFGSNITNKWGVYINDAIAKNYFGGSVLIGTTSDLGYKLAVNGSASFTSVTVGTGVLSTPAGYNMYVSGGILTEKIKAALPTSANWSDYVFDKKYRLLPLANVETYIKKNKHLPGVPSGDELVKDGGIVMNEMFAKQMEKIEELTLYIIEQNKQIELLKRRVTQLEKNR